MADDPVLYVVGIEVLKEVVKYTFGQATEALKHWKERKAQSQVEEKIASQNALPPIFEGQVTTPMIDLARVDKVEPQLDELCDSLSGYVDGRKEITTSDTRLLEKTDDLRRLLEAIYQQRLTFKGENRPPSGPLLIGEAEVSEIAGKVTGLKLRGTPTGEARGKVTADIVAPGGEATGAEIDLNG